MLAIKTVIALLFLISLAFGFTTIEGNLSSYNPGDDVGVTVTNNETGACSQPVHVFFNKNETLNVTCSDTSYSSCPPNATAVVSCSIPADLINGPWSIFVRNDYDSTDFKYSNFTLNSTNANLSASSLIFSPGDTLTYYLITRYVNGNPFNINTSRFNLSVNVNSILNCSNLTNSSAGNAGNYSATCVVNRTAGPGSYQMTGGYPNFNLSTNVTFNFTVNVSYRAPNVTLNVSSFRMERNTSYYVNISIWSSSNVGDTYYVNVTNCDGGNLSCSLNSSTNEVNISAFGYASMILNVTSWPWSNATNYSLGINVSNLSNIAYGNKTTLTAIVNPFHNFSWWTDNSPTGSVPAGQTITYTFRVNNTGENVSNYSLSCSLNNANFTCAFNQTVNNSINAGPGNLTYFNVSVTASNSSALGEKSRVLINITDYFGLSQLIDNPPGTYFNTTVTGNLGNVTVDNTSRYVHNVGEKYSFTISINNTGNIDGNDTIFNVSITALNSGGWSLYLTNYSNFSNFIVMNDSYMANFTLNISSLSYQYIFVNVTVPSGATSQNFTRLSVYVNSSKNGSRFDNKNVTIKLPIYNFSIGMVYNRTTENLSVAVYNVSVENGMLINGTWVNYTLNYTILASNGSVKTTNLNITAGTIYYLNTTGWLTGLYNLTMCLNTTTNYNSSFLGSFYISRWTALPVPTASAILSVVLGSNITLTVTNSFDNSSDSVNLTNLAPPFHPYFRGNGTQANGVGGYCVLVANTTYQYICTASNLANGNTTYNLTISTEVINCSRDFNCTFSPSLTNYTSIGIGEITNVAGTPPSNQSGGQSPPSSSNTTNRTTTTITGLKFTVPSNVTLLNTSQTIYILLNNTNTSRQNISVNISEASDYLHFNLSYVAPKNISGNSTSTINITLTPFKWAKPGNYTVSITINSMNTTLTVTVPQSNVTKKVYRYVEVSKNRATSMVTLSVKNRNSYSAFMNITENISKQIAASAKNVTIISAINYTVIEQDPVILWTMNMSQNQERSIVYLVAGDLGNSNLFNEPNVTEGRMSTGGGGGTTAKGEDMTWLIIGIIVVVVIAAAVVVYLFFLKPRGIKLPIKYGAFVKQEKKGGGVLGALKGIPTKIMSIFKREKKEAPVGEKKSIFSRLSFKKRAEIKEEPKKEEKRIAPGRPKPTKEDLLKKLNEVYKK